MTGRKNGTDWQVVVLTALAFAAAVGLLVLLFSVSLDEFGPHTDDGTPVSVERGPLFVGSMACPGVVAI